MKSNDIKKWAAGILATLVASGIAGGVAWAQSTHGEIQRLNERTAHLEDLRRDVEDVKVNLARLCERLDIRAQDWRRRGDE